MAITMETMVIAGTGMGTATEIMATMGTETVGIMAIATGMRKGMATTRIMAKVPLTEKAKAS